ncbi:PKD domain containing protein [Methanoregula boonei 6A8]|uniref:PKD domain containing protein n=1 Tax=Methanoregula boonei (strain DSM 21154 / JCM 14090 / 6A8) TaxID=456442 RepID=A7IB24_METB6|nr:PKD domain-containing protein [Methanoregula boonei]ABS56935.1 PKD domain containing protein [Methanoregula boonei 6A8]
MYKPGVIACLFIVLLVGACGCSLAASGSGTANGTTAREMPTLPDTYVAGEGTPVPGNTVVTPAPVNTGPANIAGDQTNVTMTETSLPCNGNSCGFVSNSTSSNPDAPVSSFSANVTKVYVVPPNPVVPIQFTDGSTNSPTSWYWLFGEYGSTSDAQNPLFTYQGYNYYNVTLIAKNTYGSSSSTATISVCPVMTSFVSNTTNGNVPLTVNFTDTSAALSGTPSAYLDSHWFWKWDFGDGVTSTLQNPTHTYTAAGDYTVRLDSGNDLGSCWNTAEIVVQPFTATFTADPTSGLNPLTVLFVDTTTDPTETGRYWDFGDGTTSTMQHPTHTYSTAGNYVVTFDATDAYGWSNQTTTITVYSLPSVDFSAIPTSGVAGTTVSFIDESSGTPGPTSWYWDFGDGFDSTAQNPPHQYASAGMYTVSHSATNAHGTVWMNKTAYITIT